MKYLIVALLKAYRYAISPLLPSACRFYPSCSSYAIEAIEKYGFWKGTWLAIGRVLRCQPFCAGGHDPVR
jgi:uncharacterized protein